MTNLTLYTTRAEGNRILAKYFQPPQETIGDHPPPALNATGLASLGARNPYTTLKEQHALEHAVWDKARRSNGDIFQYDGNLVLFKSSYDVFFFVIAPERENELMMHSFMMSMYEALSNLLQSQIDKRTILDNLDLVTLAIDESVDDGIILETDSAAIANRVTRPRSDAVEVQQVEQTLLNAYTSFRDKFAQRLSAPCVGLKMSASSRSMLREPLQSAGTQHRKPYESHYETNKTGRMATLRPVSTKEDQNREPASGPTRAYPLPTRSSRAQAENGSTENFGYNGVSSLQRTRSAKTKAELITRAPTPKSGTRINASETSFSSAKRMFSNAATTESSVMARSKSSRRDSELARPRLSRTNLSGFALKKDDTSTTKTSTAGAGAVPSSLPPLKAAAMRRADPEREDVQAYEYLCHCSEAQQWIEQCIGEPLGGDIANMGEEMRNGIALAKLAKSFEPSCVPRIFVHPRLQFRHTDNINYFFQFADKIRLPNCFRFELTDLYEKKNFPKVVYCLHALSHFMAHLGRSDKVDDLVGKLQFNPEQLDKTQKSLDAQGGTLPSFGGVGQALAQEMGMSAGAQHSVTRKADADWIKPSKKVNSVPLSPPPKVNAAPNKSNAFAVNLKPVSERLGSNPKPLAPKSTPAPSAIPKTQSKSSMTDLSLRKSNTTKTIPEEARERAVQLSRERERKRLEQEREWERQRHELQEERMRQREQRGQRISALGREREQQRAEQLREREREKDAKRAEEERERERERERRESEYRRERERTQKEHELQRAQDAALARERQRADRAEKQERERIERLEHEQKQREERLVRERMEEEQAMRAAREQEQFQRELAFELERKRQLEAHAAELEEARAETRAAELRLQQVAQETARRQEEERNRILAKWNPMLISQCAGVLSRQAFQTQRLRLSYSEQVFVKLQAQLRGVAMRNAQRAERARLASEHDVKALIQLQAALRAELFRRTFYQRFEALDDAEIGVMQFQAHARGALARRSIFSVLISAERKTDVYVRIQACVRTVLAQQRLLHQVQALRSGVDSFAHFQAHARGVLARRKYQRTMLSLAHVQVVSSVQNLQTALRAAVQRGKHSQVRKQLAYTQPSVIRVQAAIRGVLARQEFRWWAGHLYQSEPVAIHLQALVRGTLARRSFRRSYGHYLSHIPDIVKVQSVVRAHMQGAQYRALLRDHPPLSAVRFFAQLLDSSDADFAGEIALEQLRAQIFARIQQNKVTEATVSELEMKNAILIRNKIGIEDAAKSRNERGLLGHASQRNSVLAKAQDPFSEQSQDRPTARRRELYQGLFYLLQTRPEYLAKLIVLTTASTTLPEQDRVQFEQTVLLLYNYAQQPREQYWLLRLLRSAVQEHLKATPSLQSFVQDDAAFQKRLVQYSKGVRERSYFAQVLGPLVLPMAQDASLHLETDPSVIYRELYALEQANSELRPTRAPNADFDEALNHPETRTIFIRHLQSLRTSTEQFFNAFKAAAPPMPYGMRFVARELFCSLTARFPHMSHDAVLSSVCEVMYQRYLHPAIVGPETVLDACPVLSPEMRRNLTVISQMLLQIARGQPFGEDQPCLQPLSEYVMQAAPRFQRWMQSLIEGCIAPELHFGVDEYTDAASAHRPIIYISPNEIYAVHQLLCNNLASLVTSPDDPLAHFLSELGNPPLASSAELEEARSKEVALELTMELAGMRDPDGEAKNLFVETKRLVLAVVKVQTGEDLLSVFLTEVTEKDELRWKALLAHDSQRQLSTGKPDANLASTPLGELHSMSFAELKVTALENLIRLEQMGRVQRSDAFQAMLDALALDIRTRHQRRFARQAEQQMLTNTLHKLHQREAFMQTQIAEYQRYADQTLKTMPRRSHTKTLPFTKQYFHRRSLKAAGILPKFGSYIYSARRLLEKGLLTAIDAPENMSIDQVAVTISSDELGEFLIEAAVSNVPAGTSKILMEELLEAQYNGHHTIAVLDRTLIFDVNCLIQWINKKFYA
ncbi:iqgap- protein [Malassezia yamatoensis]|uniref:Zeta-coat protein n=1 Tax=Malassezia yamatoensis TaxID=253288 RepID=A0AAJ5YNT8_9BASI|nr:iqgap- protein [Malassezia yamatoensis]